MPEKGKYPPDWESLRAEAFIRAGNRCEWCAVPDRATVMRFTGEFASYWATDDGGVFDGAGKAVHGFHFSDAGESRFVYIVLAVAHLDYEVSNCSESNLRVLCQRCNLRHLAPLAKAGRRRKKYKDQMRLWEDQ